MEILLKQVENEIYRVMDTGNLFNPVDAPLRFCFPVAIPAEIGETPDIVIKINRTATMPGIGIQTLSDKIVITFQGKLPSSTADTAPIEFDYGRKIVHTICSTRFTKKLKLSPQNTMLYGILNNQGLL